MRKNVQEFIKSKAILRNYLREQPRWYRTLTRNPQDLQRFEFAALQYYHQTIPDKIEKITNSIELASLMVYMLQSAKQND